ncbi:MAG: molybdenum cofactor biosynthesis protein, partial [Chloroflexi bacterium]|nr:molybdenum cofactor biosynthesis protein [Chloroflexota bacterium]
MSKPLRFGILTISDRSASDEREDLSGPALVKVIVENGWDVIAQTVIHDDRDDIKKILIEWVDRSD